MTVGFAGIARADIFKLKDGSEIEGQILLEKPDKYWIRTATGARWIGRTDVSSVVKKLTPWERYESAKKTFPMTGVGQFELAMWCGENGLASEKEKHLRMSVGLDPNYEPACLALGYTKQGDRWVPPRRDDLGGAVVPRPLVPRPGTGAGPSLPTPPSGNPAMPPTGAPMVPSPQPPAGTPEPVPNPVNPPADKAARDAAEAAMKARNLWAFHIAEIDRGMLRRLDDNVRLEGVRKLEAIQDPLAVDGMIEVFAGRKEPEYRRLGMRQLGRFRTDRATFQLIITAITDSEPSVAEEARRALARQADPRTGDLLKAGLKGPDDLLDRVAAALGVMGDIHAAPALIEVLSGRSRLTCEKDPDNLAAYVKFLQRSLGGSNPVFEPNAALLTDDSKGQIFQGNLTVGPKARQPTSFRMRAEVQAALVALASEQANYGFDRSAWSAWYERVKARQRVLERRPN